MAVRGICSLQMGAGKRKENAYSLFSVYEGHISYKGVIYKLLLGAGRLLEGFQQL